MERETHTEWDYREDREEEEEEAAVTGGDKETITASGGPSAGSLNTEEADGS